MDTLLSPEGGLVAVFLAGFLAATVLPLSSEAVLFGYLRLHPGEWLPALVCATAGNTLGGLSTYALGRLVPERTHAKLDARALAFLSRHGSPLTLLAWLPVIGDAICLAAGWLRLNWLACAAWMAVGRALRYLAVAWLAG